MAATFPTSPTNGQTAIVGGVGFVYDSTAGVWNQLQTSTSSPTLTSPVLNTSISGTAVKDEDTMSSDSATALATQQSIKAYVDTSISSFSTTLSGLTDTTISTPSSGQVLKYNGSAWINDTDSGGGATWESKSADFTASASTSYFVNTSSGAVTATLPASPTQGDEVRFLDVKGTFDTNNLTVARNGNPIQGDASDMTVSTERAGFSLVFFDATEGWLLRDV